KSAQIREILISESAWEEMTCLFAPSLTYPGYCCHRFPYRPPGAATSARRHVTKSGEPAGFGVSWM
ncbi:hypothetical protein BME28_14195, partial [Klebsiella pneumoniae]